MRILVTGANGFIGRHSVLELLTHGHEVHGAGRSDLPFSEKIVWHKVDLLQPGAASELVRQVQPEAILHLAWAGEPGRFWNDPTNLNWISATIELALAAVEVGVRRACVAGTCFEYDWPRDGDCDEVRTPILARTFYGISKDACRRSIKWYLEQSKVSFAWSRLFYVYGPFEHPDRLVASIARSLIADKPALVTRGLGVRDYMDSRDVGSALARVLGSDVEGEINVASGRATSIASIAMTLGSIVGRPDLIRVGALPDRDNDPPRITASVARLRDEVRFEPNISIETGLRDAIEFWRHHEEN